MKTIWESDGVDEPVLICTPREGGDIKKSNLVMLQVVAEALEKIGDKIITNRESLQSLALQTDTMAKALRRVIEQSN